MKKRLISLLICAAMLLSLAPESVFAVRNAPEKQSGTEQVLQEDNSGAVPEKNYWKHPFIDGAEVTAWKSRAAYMFDGDLSSTWVVRVVNKEPPESEFKFPQPVVLKGLKMRKSTYASEHQAFSLYVQQEGNWVPIFENVKNGSWEWEEDFENNTLSGTTYRLNLLNYGKYYGEVDEYQIDELELYGEFVTDPGATVVLTGGEAGGITRTYKKAVGDTLQLPNPFFNEAPGMTFKGWKVPGIEELQPQKSTITVTDPHMEIVAVWDINFARDASLLFANVNSGMVSSLFDGKIQSGPLWSWRPEPGTAVLDFKLKNPARIGTMKLTANPESSLPNGTGFTLSVLNDEAHYNTLQEEEQKEYRENLLNWHTLSTLSITGNGVKSQILQVPTCETMSVYRLTIENIPTAFNIAEIDMFAAEEIPAEQKTSLTIRSDTGVESVFDWMTGTELAAPYPLTSRPTMAFVGWVVNGEAGTLVQPGTRLTIAGATRLEARWTPKKYVTVTAEPNGGAGSLIQFPDREENTRIQLPECTYTAPAGQYFTGWMVQYPGDTAGKRYFPKEKVVVKDGMTVTAQWEVPRKVTNQTEWTTGAYVVDSDVTINERIVVKGDVTLILEAAGKLTANSGICVAQYNSLSIGGQGMLHAKSTYYYAAIGGETDATTGTIVINSGTIIAEAPQYESGSPAAIGSGTYNDFGGLVIINGGHITATTGAGGQAIGNGWSTSNGRFQTGSNCHATIIANQPIENSAKESWSGFISEDNGVTTIVYGVQQLEQYEIAAGNELIINKELSLLGNLTIAETGKLTINANARLNANGKVITCRGLIAGEGMIIGDGIFKVALTDVKADDITAPNGFIYTGTDQKTALLNGAKLTRTICGKTFTILDWTPHIYKADKECSSVLDSGTDYFVVYTKDADPSVMLRKQFTIAQAKLDGTVTIENGTLPQFGAVLTAHFTGKAGTASQNLTTGQLNFQWYRDDIKLAGQEQAAYTVTREDIGHHLKCVVSAKDTVNFTGFVEKNTSNLAEKADNTTLPSVDLNPDTQKLTTSGIMEYAVGSGNAWTACTDNMHATAFGWDGSKALTVRIRFAETATHKAGAAVTAVIPKLVTASFATAGGTAVASVSKLPGASFTLPAAPAQSGYGFTCWKIGEAAYTPGASYIMPDSDISFTAQWALNKPDAPAIHVSPDKGVVTYPDGIVLTAQFTEITGIQYTYQWYRDGKAVAAGKTLNLVNVADSGSYTVRVTAAGKGQTQISEISVSRNVTIGAAVIEGSIQQSDTITYTGSPLTANTVSTLSAHDQKITVHYGLSADDCSLPTVPEFTDAGSYTVYYRAAALNHLDKTGHFTVTVKTADSAVNAPVKNTLTYDGNSHALVAAGNTSDGTLYYGLGTDSGTAPDKWQTGIPTGTDAGSYYVWYYVKGDSNHNDTEPLCVTVPVAPRNIQGAVITWGDNLIYNGETQEMTITAVTVDGLKAAFTVTGSTGKNAGTYTLTVQGTGNFTGTITADWTITPFAATVVPDSDQSKIYGSQDPVFTYTANLFEKDTLLGALGREEGKNVGSYGFTLGSLNHKNYTLKLAEKMPVFAITPKKLTVDVSVADKAYDGTNKAEIQSAVLQGLVSDDDVTLHSGKATFKNAAVGTDIPVFFTEFTVSGKDIKNYILTQPSGITASITNTWTPGADREYTLSGTGWLKESLIISAKPDYLLSATNTVSGSWTETLTGSTQGAASTLSFYVKNTQTGAISLAMTETYQLDQVIPTGSVTIGRTTWQEFLHTISFGLLYPEEQQLKVEAQDALSGVDRIQYVESAGAMTLEEVKALPENAWQNAEGNLKISAKDGKQFVCYIRITDKAGNIAYLSTQGGEFDLTAPEIAGVQDKGVYYTARKITVTDQNNVTVTVNGEPVTGIITIPEAKKNTVYTIAAADEAGNKTTVIITMKPIADVYQPIDGMQNERVTSSDRAAVKTVISDISSLLKDENLSESQRRKLESVKAEAHNLLQIIDAAAAALKTDAIKAAETVTPETAELKDRQKLETAKQDLETALAQQSKHYTDAEKAAARTKLETVTSLLQAIARAENAVNQTDSLPSQTEPDDLETEAKILEAQKIYDSLTDQEKRMAGDSMRQKLDRLQRDLKNYKVIKGGGSVWKNEAEGLTLVVNGAPEKFKGLLIDGKPVAPENYTVKSGSTVLTLKDSYLKTLENKEYTLTFQYENGEVTGTVTVMGADAEPTVPSETPEQTKSYGSLLWIAVLAAAVAVILLVIKKKRK